MFAIYLSPPPDSIGDNINGKTVGIIVACAVVMVIAIAVPIALIGNAFNETEKKHNEEKYKGLAEELMSLPGIGESRAAWIIEYRTKNGPFQKKEDIMQVKGIKDGIFSKIKDRISVE